MYKISVVMPIYNNETTLRRAIESILNQSIFDFELILINDGSTDSSSQICKEFAKKEPLVIQVIHQERLGFAQTRNRGLAMAKGNYIYFADAENILAPRMLETTLRLAEEKSAELVVFGFIETEEAVEQIPKMPVLLTNERFRNHYRNFHNFFPYELCNKLYQVHYLKENKIKFYNYPLKEVAFFNVAIYQDLNKVVFNRNVLCQKGKSNKLQQGYDENNRVMHQKLIDKLSEMFAYWELTDEYRDVIIEEYCQLLEDEVMTLSSSTLSLSSDEIEEEIEKLLLNEDLNNMVANEKKLATKGIYKRVLWNNIQKRNVQAIIQLVQGEKRRVKITRTIKNTFNQWFLN